MHTATTAAADELLLTTHASPSVDAGGIVRGLMHVFVTPAMQIRELLMRIRERFGWQPIMEKDYIIGLEHVIRWMGCPA